MAMPSRMQRIVTALNRAGLHQKGFHARCLSTSIPSYKRIDAGPESNTSSRDSTATRSPAPKTTAMAGGLLARTMKNPFKVPASSVLAYVGPHTSALRSGKAVAFVFGACGCIAVPSTFYLGTTEHLLAIMAGVAALSPSMIIHSLFRNDVTKIHVQGTVSNKAPSVVKVSTSEALKLSFEKLNWHGKPLQTQVLSTDLAVHSQTDKTVTWITTEALPATLDSAPSSKSGAPTRAMKSGPKPQKQLYRIDKLMMLNNPSFAFVLDQIEQQSPAKQANKVSLPPQPTK
ncbi:hypothetical protein BGW38_003940 [Lunasporangiospora selenospora]|uniref:Uncharacterized protein n=1 Tax=Lunasporangiospora selenospora TaxID=979761 RepID=A0A9P6FQC8_9FUNG|nr:hypothetical protein BGW38_003940 [Lunasporangiospora selenospora]